MEGRSMIVAPEAMERLRAQYGLWPRVLMQAGSASASANQRQGSALRPDKLARMGLCQRLPYLRRPRRRPAAVATSAQLA
jgi:hypothetical protein